MADLPSRAQLFEVGANDLLVRAETRPVGQRITPEQVSIPGSDVNLIFGGASAMAEEIIRQHARDVSDLTLDGAEGKALDRLVADRYSPSIVRKDASPAYISLSFTRTSAAAGAVNYDAGSVVETTGGARFATQAVAAFGASSLGPVVVSGRAVNAGPSGNVAIGTVTKFVTAKTDSTMLVTNTAVGAGGDYTESDSSLKSRARAFFPNARRGTVEAIMNGALSVPGVQQAAVYELLQAPLMVPSGFMTCFVADSNGQSNSLLNAAVELALFEYRGGGVWVTVYGGTPVYQSIQLDLSYNAGIDTVAAWSNVRAAVIAVVNALAPGKMLEVSMITAAARLVTGVIVEDDAVVVPAGDVVPTGGQVIRTRADLVTPA